MLICMEIYIHKIYMSVHLATACVNMNDCVYVCVCASVCKEGCVCVSSYNWVFLFAQKQNADNLGMPTTFIVT